MNIYTSLYEKLINGEEKLSLVSAARVWTFLLEVLKNI